MPKFPTKEADIKILLAQMLDGYTRYPADFPHVNRSALTSKRLLYVVVKKAHIEALARMRLATKAAEDSLQELIQVMKNCLKKSEVDVADDTVKLAQIGWGPKTTPQPVELPGEPKNLIVEEQGKTTVRLRWERPDGDCSVRNYIIERRKADSSGTFGKWIITGTSISDEIILMSQPKGIQLEYRVKAANLAGESTPGNIAAVVL